MPAQMIVRRRLVAACAVLSASLLPGCALPGGPPPASAPFCLADVQSHTMPERGAAGDFSAIVRFDAVSIAPGTIGYGAAGERSDEITIADGVLHLARPDGAGGFSERRAAAPGEGAYMLHTVTAGGWRAPVPLAAVPSLDALGAAMASGAARAGCPGPAKLAYRIEGRVVEAKWSLETRPSRADYVTRSARAVIVGLYATTGQAGHSVPEPRNIHAHIILPDLGVAGHLNAVSLEPGALLRLQAE